MIVVCELAAPFLPRSRWDDQRQYFEHSFSRSSKSPAGLCLPAEISPGRSIRVSRFRRWRGYFCIKRAFTSAIASRVRFDRSLLYDTAVRMPLEDARLFAQQKPVDPGSIMEGSSRDSTPVRSANTTQGRSRCFRRPSRIDALPREKAAASKGASLGNALRNSQGRFAFPLRPAIPLGRTPFAATASTSTQTQEPNASPNAS